MSGTETTNFKTDPFALRLDILLCGRPSEKESQVRNDSNEQRRSQQRRSPALAQLISLACIVALCACAAPIGVKRISAQTAERQFAHSILSSGELSEDALTLLRRTGQVENWKDDPAAVLAWLHSRILRPVDEFTAELRAQFLDDIAELNFAYAADSGDKRYYLASAMYAWRFLLPPKGAARASILSRGIRRSADLYNRGLTLALMDPETGKVILRDGTHELPFGTLEIDLDETTLSWGDRKFAEFTSLTDLEVNGLINRYRLAGIGAPLAATLSPPESGDAEDLIFSEVRAPVTALLIIEDSATHRTDGKFFARLDIIPYADTDVVELEDNARLSLESEPSAALALQLTETPPWKRELAGFFQGDLAMGQPGIVSLAPYHAGRIPIVLVHGTASSAGRWADLLNDLQTDSVLRRRYQFWLFTYNTGNPIAYSGWLLRKAISDLVDELDPNGEDPALRDIVVMGHSQGGLLTKLMVVDSGEKFWDTAFDRPPEEMELEPENRELLEGALLVKPLPSVKRAIFLSTPHHGSRLANLGLARLMGRMVRAPANIIDATQDAFKDDPDSEVLRRLKRSAGSVDNMSPNNGFIKTLAALPVAPGVKSHSIMGVKKGPKEEGTDGVVTYASAHLDGVDSELVVQSGHSSQSNPFVISEVHRILIEHLRDAIELGIVEDFKFTFER